MVVTRSGRELQEGDWLEKEVKIGSRTIKKSVHGLSVEDIRLLRKSGTKVWIKRGIPFTPAFLIALLFMGYVFLVLGLPQVWALGF